MDVSRSRAAQAHMDWVDLSATVIPPEVINQIRAEDARRYKVIPVGFGESGLIVAVSDPLDIDTIDSLSFLLQREIELVCASPEKIRQALIKYYGTADKASDTPGAKNRAEAGFDLEIAEATTSAPRRRQTHRSFAWSRCFSIEAHRLGASDVHLEPLDKTFRVRFRIDGVLQEMQAPPKRLQSAIVSRLKIMTGSMSIAEKRLPQDGRIQVRIAREADRSARFHHSHQPRRKHRHARARQIEPHARAARARIFQRRPGNVRAVASPAGWHPARNRPDRVRQNEHALLLPELHQQTGPQDHYGRGADRISNERHQPGAGEH